MIATRASRPLLLTLSLCLLVTSAAFTQQQVAQIDIGNNAVTWNPLTADKMVLTVSGPSGDFRFELEASEPAAFDILDKAGALLQDGSYTWQIITLPTVDDATRAALQKARAEGISLDGALPQSVIQSGALKVQDGYFVLPAQETADRPARTVAHNKDIILDDLIVVGNICAGLDCVSGESFGLDTLRLKDDNLRIKFQDTSSGGSFPTNDWQITVNDTNSGGADRFSIDDIDGGRTPFTIEAGAPSHALYVDDNGRIGVGTSTPVAELHVVHGESPTVRLEQDGSSGFALQTWEMGGNETNWFVRDVTHGSRLPFKIIHSAPTNALVIDTDGDVGLGTASPDASLHVTGDDGTTQFLVEDNSTSATNFDGMLNIESAATSGVVSAVNIVTAGARPRFTMTHGNVLGLGGPASWNFDVLNTTGHFAFILGGSAGLIDFTFETDGDLNIPGNFISSGITLSVPDYVFADDYELMPLDEVKAFIDAKQHLPEVPSAAEVQAEGLDVTHMQMTLLKKVEELTLYTLDLHETNRDQHETIRSQQDTIQQLMERVEALESVRQ